MHRTIHGLPFAYESHGEGTPIVLLHAMPTDRRSVVPRFEPMFAALPGRWRRIYPDLPGAGETPALPDARTHDAYVDAVATFLEEETGGEPFALLGLSWGAITALAYAQRRPERLAGLALLAPRLAPRTATASSGALVTEPGVFDGEPAVVREMMTAAATVHTRAVRDVMKRDVVPGASTADRAYMGVIAATMAFPGGDAVPVAFAGPSLVVTGRQDPVAGHVEPRKLAERMPRATFVALDRAAHVVAIEQEPLVRALVGEWLARVREGLGEGYETLDHAPV